MSESLPCSRTPGIKGQKPLRVLVKSKAVEETTACRAVNAAGRERLTDRRRIWGKPQRVPVDPAVAGPAPKTGLKTGARRVLLQNFDASQGEPETPKRRDSAKTPSRKGGSFGTGSVAPSSALRARTAGRVRHDSHQKNPEFSGLATGVSKPKQRNGEPFWASPAGRIREARRLDMSASLEPVERPVTTTGRKVDTAAHPNPRTSRGGSSFESTARPAPVTSAASYPRRPADGGAPTALCPAPRPNRACSGVEVLVPRPLGASTAGSDMPAVGLQHASVSLTACASWAGSSLVTAPPAPAASTACDLEVPANGGADTAVSPPPRGVWGSARASIFAPLAPERSESPASRLKMPADGRSYTAMGPAPAAGPEAPTGGGAKAALSPAACTSPGEPSLGVFAPSPPDTSTVRFEAPAGGGPVAVATCSPRASRGAFSTAVATPLPPGASPPSSYMVLATPTSFRTPGGAYVPPPDLNPSQPSFGSVKTFSQVKAKRALREQLGNDTVVTPVRRSARKSNAKPTASVTALLEAAHYSYAPNAYLP